MNKLPLPAALLAATLSLAVAPALAVAETPTPTTVPVPTPPVPIAGTVKLALQKVGGAPPFALAAPIARRQARARAPPSHFGTVASRSP